MSKSPVHYVSSNESTRTLCGINLIGSSNRKAPFCSTDDKHITCPACSARRRSWACDPERFTVGQTEALATASTETLTAALREAERVFATCGGHKLANRMSLAIRNITDELEHRELDNELTTEADRAAWSSLDA